MSLTMERGDQVESPMKATTGRSADVPTNLDEWKKSLTEMKQRQQKLRCSHMDLGWVM